MVQVVPFMINLRLPNPAKGNGGQSSVLFISYITYGTSSGIFDLPEAPQPKQGNVGHSSGLFISYIWYK